MRIAFVLLITFLTACNSSDNNAPPAVGITIPDNPREILAPIDDVAFSGDFNSTSGSGDTIDGIATGVTADSGSADTSDGAADGSTDGSIDGSAVDAPEASDSIVLPGPGPGTQITPGTLTAGTYDDHLNPHLYQHYANSYLQQRGQWIDTPRLDFNNRILIEVTDTAGVPSVDATIEVESNNGESIITLGTPATGVTSLYAELDNLPEDFLLRITATDGSSLQQAINLSQAVAAGRILATLPAADQSQTTTPAQTPIDLMFVVDTTGSMGDELGFLQTELSDIINSVTLQQSTIQIGFVFYRDNGDVYTVRSHEFSADLNSVQSALNQESANGGGDYPEAMDQALWAAVNANWRSDSRKVLFLIADAPPHGDRMRATWNAAEQARLKNIHIVPVAASGVAEDAEYIMRSTAALTNGRHLFLTDDSGFGSPHNEPDIECYIVTSLQLAMTNALNSLVTGGHFEPSANEIIRQVGNYNNGVCEQNNTRPEPMPVQHTVLVDRLAPPNGAFTEEAFTDFTTQAELNEALARYGEEAQTVDFDTGQVLLIDRGVKPSGGFAIENLVLQESEDKITVAVDLTRPGDNCGVDGALTNPYVFVYIPSTKLLVIEARTVVRECLE